MPFPTTGILDAFNRANEGPPPSASWGGDPFAVGLPGLKVVSNQCVANGAYAVGWWLAAFGADQEVFITPVTWASEQIEVYARLQGGVGTSAVDGYQFRFDSAASEVKIYSLTNASASQLGATISQAVVAGDSIGASCVGSTVSAWIKPSASAWTLVGSRTDATYPAGGCIGALVPGPGNGDFDNFGGGTYAPTFVSAPTLSDMFAVASGGRV